MKSIQIEYFAVLRDHVGCAGETVSTVAETPGDLYTELQARYTIPEIGTVKVAINAEFSDWHASLQDGDTVVFIPPVAGG